jgi:FKBP-type peptidyl-prolyl cis-trans isomerase FkpA
MVKYCGLLLAALGCLGLVGISARADEEKEQYKERKIDLGDGQSAVLKYQDLKEGTGQEVIKGDNVVVHYTGWLTSGRKFDSSIDRGKPFSFVLGGGNVIKGWDAGVAGMKVGGKRKLVIPPELGYGATGAGRIIPPNATLIFEIQLLKIE